MIDDYLHTVSKALNCTETYLLKHENSPLLTLHPYM